ncbi:FecR domain-containing protein [Sphingomonas sp.]|uniref:FecR family protein n=1 Tax=Sphingomonas sp. TaxID=28214 RepID=UPI0025F1B97E|nr:FecR domain-containing protein [Sphingomonas sp.]
MQIERGAIIDQAIGWHVRLAEARDDEWGDFVAWLEADPAHAAAYDIVAREDHIVGDARFPEPVPEAANDNSRSRRWFVAGGAAAAAAIAALLAPGMLATRPAPYELATKPGERRMVALDDGTRIEMSGGTRIRLDRADPRVASLQQGEATFHVRHDADRPFAIKTGGITIRDLGTVFNVDREGDKVTVAVAEGSVSVEPGRDGVTLVRGDALTIDQRSGSAVRSKVSPESVGGWRSGDLSFDGATVGEAIATFNRLYGADVVADPDLSARPFTGMLRFTGAADRDVPHLATAIGANWRRDGQRWILSNGAPPTR